MKGTYMFVHKSFGTAMAGLVLPRLALRAATKIPTAVPGATWEKAAATASHLAL